MNNSQVNCGGGGNKNNPIPRFFYLWALAHGLPGPLGPILLFLSAGGMETLCITNWLDLKTVWFKVLQCSLTTQDTYSLWAK